jgi:hypothetical protein
VNPVEVLQIMPLNQDIYEDKFYLKLRFKGKTFPVKVAYFHGLKEWLIKYVLPGDHFFISKNETELLNACADYIENESCYRLHFLFLECSH